MAVGAAPAAKTRSPNQPEQISLNHMIRQDSRFINAEKFD